MKSSPRRALVFSLSCFVSLSYSCALTLMLSLSLSRSLQLPFLSASVKSRLQNQKDLNNEEKALACNEKCYDANGSAGIAAGSWTVAAAP